MRVYLQHKLGGEGANASDARVTFTGLDDAKDGEGKSAAGSGPVSSRQLDSLK